MFHYKLKWFKRLGKHARTLLKESAPVILAGDSTWRQLCSAFVRPDLGMMTLSCSRRAAPPSNAREPGLGGRTRTTHPDASMCAVTPHLQATGVDAARRKSGASDHAAWVILE